MKKKVLDYILIILLSFYLSISLTWHDLNIIKFIVIFSISFILFYLVWLKLIIKPSNKKLKKWEYIIYSLIIIIPFLIAFLSYYPGYASKDTLDIWNEVQSNVYSNWHPLIYTLLFYKLPSLIYNNIVSSTIMQLIVIYIILLYLCYFLRKYFLDFKWTTIVLLLTVLNPIFIRYSVVLWKDIPYSYFILLLTLLVIEITITKGNWLDTIGHKIIFIISSLAILLFRHNGIIPFILIFIFLIIYYSKYRKFLGITLIVILLSNYLLTGPVYNYFNIGKNGGKSEMVGLILGQISYYYNNDIEFSEKEKVILNDLAPLEYWNKYYNPKNFNKIKWQNSNINQEIDKHFTEIISMWKDKSIHNFDAFVISYLNMTSPIWEINKDLEGINHKVTVHETSITKKGNMEDLSLNTYKLLVKYNNFKVLRVFFISFGEGLFIIIFSLFISFSRTKLNVRKWLPYILVLSNTLVIMLLITGEEYRFVYSQIICAIPLLIYGISSYVKEENEDNETLKIYNKIFKEKTNNTVIQFIRYLFVGGIAAVVNIGMLYVFTELFKIYYIISNIMSFILGLIVNYVLSKKLVFQEETSISKKKEFMIYGIIGVIGLGIDTLMVWLISKKMYYMISKIISTIIVFVWNFGARKVLYKVLEKR